MMQLISNVRIAEFISETGNSSARLNMNLGMGKFKQARHLGILGAILFFFPT